MGEEGIKGRGKYVEFCEQDRERVSGVEGESGRGEKGDSRERGENRRIEEKGGR